MRVPQDTADRWGAVASEKFLPGYCPSRCWPPLLTSRGCRVRFFWPSPFGFSGSDGAQARHATLSAIVRFLFSGFRNRTAMGPPLCSGYTEHGEKVECRFHQKRPGERALGTFSGRCTWCNETRMQEQCEAGSRQRKLLGSAPARQPLRSLAIPITTVANAICVRCEMFRC